MGLGNDLLTILSSYSGGYRLMRQRINGYYGASRGKLGKNVKELKDDTLRKTLSRLKARGLVENSDRIWKITQKGKDYEARRIDYPSRRIFHKIHSRQERNMIVAFDIPEEKRRARDWLRFELRLLDFKPLQKSVWIGPAPLPSEFVKSLSDLNLIRFVKFFRATEVDIV